MRPDRGGLTAWFVSGWFVSFRYSEFQLLFHCLLMTARSPPLNVSAFRPERNSSLNRFDRLGWLNPIVPDGVHVCIGLAVRLIHKPHETAQYPIASPNRNLLYYQPTARKLHRHKAT